jgi:two-component system sensor kinase FixL
LGVSEHNRQSTDLLVRVGAGRPGDGRGRLSPGANAPDVSTEFAHELNQSLSAIMSYVKATKRTLEAIEGFPVERTSALLASAAEETLRAGAIVRSLRWLSEKRIRERTPENLARLIEEAVALGVPGDGEPRVHVLLDLDPHLPTLMIDKVRLQQVLVHLIRNSIEAMAEQAGGELTLSTRLDDEGFAEVCVSDTGVGLPTTVAERLFHPFVTTKEKRVGIGLAICKAIVESHGGTIWAIEMQPQGTGFVFRLPIVEEGEAVA